MIQSQKLHLPEENKSRTYRKWVLKSLSGNLGMNFSKKLSTLNWVLSFLAIASLRRTGKKFRMKSSSSLSISIKLVCSSASKSSSKIRSKEINFCLRDTSWPAAVFFVLICLHYNVKHYGITLRHSIISKIYANTGCSRQYSKWWQKFGTLSTEDRFFQDQNFSQDFGKFGTFLTWKNQAHNSKGRCLKFLFFFLFSYLSFPFIEIIDKTMSNSLIELEKLLK